MKFRLETILDIALEGQDVELFVDLLGNVQQSIIDARKTPGFKKKNLVTLTLSEDSIEFVEKVAATLNIEPIDDDRFNEDK